MTHDPIRELLDRHSVSASSTEWLSSVSDFLFTPNKNRQACMFQWNPGVG